jgi:hypothetical protein
MKKQKRKLNVRLLREVTKHILEEPRRLVMRHVSITPYSDESSFSGDGCRAQEYPPCGTAACIAGWTMLLSGEKPYDARTQKSSDTTRAGKLLGIDDDEQDALFFVSEWPHQFFHRYWNAGTPRGRAKIASDRIEHFIKTGK